MIMEEKKVELSGSCSISIITYEGCLCTDVTLEYTECSPDAWYDDTEISIDIDEEKAVEIIKALKEAFEL